MEKKLLDFVRSNSPDGGFLQSEHWRNFQEAYGRKTLEIEGKDEKYDTIIYCHIISHALPVVGSYFYAPRGPVIKIFNFQFSIFKQFLNDLICNAKKNDAGWIRIEPNSEEELNLIKENFPGWVKMKKSAVDIQPREILVMDISKSEEEILAGMKQKTRYNIRLAEKRGVRVSHNMEHGIWNKENVEDFLRLVRITAERDKITAHPEGYYRKMFEMIPPEILKLYVAEYEGKIIAANLALFFGKTGTYMHGASANVDRDAMAPYLLQWRQIQDARKAGCTRYDLGGINTEKISNLKFKISNSWHGITRFKTGFAPNTEPIKFPGCWDIVLKPAKYTFYRFMQKVKRLL